MAESFEQMLTGGHPNSLGRTIEVVDTILADPSRLDDLYACYSSPDEVVRLRTSNALKRISREHPQWLVAYIDRFLDEIAGLDQASAQWTLAELFATLRPDMSAAQKTRATAHLQHNLVHHTDWIVLNNTMQTLAEWSVDEPELRRWLLPQLERLQGDGRKSVANRARKLAARLA